MERRASLRTAAAWTPALVALAAFACEWALSGLRPTVFDNYVWLADAWLHHRLWIHFPGDWIDAVPYHGRAYVVEAPFPAVLMLPLVARFSTDANQTLASALLAAVSAGAAWTLCRRSGVPPAATALLVAFWAVGTDVLYCGMTGDVWLIAHVSAACFTMLCIAELSGKRRGWLVAAYGIAAAFSRYPLLLALPIELAWLAVSARAAGRRAVLGALRAFAVVAVPAFGAWVWYDLARWGTPLDVGYTIWYHVMDPRSNHHDATMSLANVPMQLRLFFATPPHLLSWFPWVAPGRFGTSLTFVCPGLLVALGASWRRPETRWLWALAVAVAIPSLLYYDIGGMQLGTRHALDVEPFLFALIALAIARGATWWKIVLVAYSTLAGAWMLLVWRFAPGAVF